ncbi:MAG TPA: PD-(D/E)XK nuclease family protein [Dissulfurispiraceae bacterium]|nr:PD-(D/E)XK nuclease family protein [Dissulfurispiraceae bacterium]
MTAGILPINCSLITEVADTLVADGNDYSANLVIFPGRRPAHFLRKELGRRHSAAIIPPRIVSMDDFIDMIYSNKNSNAIITSLDAVAFLYDIHLEMERRIGRTCFTALDQFIQVGMQLFHDIEELTIEFISVDKIRGLGIASGIPIPSGSFDAMADIATYAEQFYNVIKKLGRSTRAMRYCNVADNMHVGFFDKYRRIILAGFFAFTAAERKIITALQEHSSFFSLFQDGPYIKDQLTDSGIDAELINAESFRPGISMFACPDIHGEVCALGDLIEKMRNNAELDERTAIVLPSSESLFPLLRHTLGGWEEGSFNVTLGYPILRTPLFGFLKSLSELISSMDEQRVYVPAYIAFVLHPYTKNILLQGSAEVTRILFHTIEEELSGQAAPSFVKLESLEANAGMLEIAANRLRREGYKIDAHQLGIHLKDIHARTIYPFVAIKSTGSFAETCIGLVEYIHDHSTAQLHPLFYPYVEALIRALTEIRNSSLHSQSFSDVSGYFLFIERYMTSCTVPFEGTPLRGIQVLGILETRCLKFEKIFLLDANESVMPISNQNDSFIPNKGRELLGMPTQRDRDRMAHYYFSVMVGAAEEVNIFFIENDRKDKSRFVERLIWEEEQIIGHKLVDDAYRNIQYRVHLGNKHVEAVRKTEVILDRLAAYQFSPSSLDRYLSCPLKFYYCNILGLRPKDVKTDSVEKKDVGTIVHEALRHLFGRLKECILTAEMLNEIDVDKIVESIFCRRFGEHPFGAPYLLMKQVQRRLDEFIKLYFIPLITSRKVKILSSESRLTASYRGHIIAGRPDAVLNFDGRCTIIDFKTSSIKSLYSISFEKLLLEERESWRPAIGSLQLPIYRILYSAYSGIPVESIDAMYLMLGMTRVDSMIELPLFGKKDDELAGSELLGELVGILMNEIKDASVTFSAVDAVTRACDICDYGAICGRRRV